MLQPIRAVMSTQLNIIPFKVTAQFIPSLLIVFFLLPQQCMNHALKKYCKEVFETV